MAWISCKNSGAILCMKCGKGWFLLEGSYENNIDMIASFCKDDCGYLGEHTEYTSVTDIEFLNVWKEKTGKEFEPFNAEDF